MSDPAGTRGGRRHNAQLRRARLARGWSQAQVAEAVETDVVTVSRWERGVTFPSPHFRQRLCMLYSCSPADLGLVPHEPRPLEQITDLTRASRQESTLRVLRRPVSPRIAQPLTPLFGRQAELARVGELLGQPGVRLVTLCGLAGVGKTRLAQEIALALEAKGSDVAFVPLAPLHTAADILPAVSHALGLHEPLNRSGDQTGNHSDGDDIVRATLRAHLQDSSLILVLDNVEHLLPDAGRVIADLLEQCPSLRLLATSRVPLRVRGEHRMPVSPLPVPSPAGVDGTSPTSPTLLASPQVPGASSNTEALAALEQYPAVALFLYHARARRPAWSASQSQASAQAVATICRQVDGLPLALELVVPWLDVLSEQELAERLNHRLSLLVGGATDSPERHRSLRAALDWTYALLPPPAQRTLRWLAPYRGSWAASADPPPVSPAHAANATPVPTADASVPATGTDEPTPPIDLAQLLTLAEHHLIQQSESNSGSDVQSERRFTLLETVREYAQERLEEAGEADEAYRAHAQRYLSLAEAARQGLTGPQQQRWLARLEVDHDNLRAALRWAIDYYEAATALRLVGALWRFWYLRGDLSEGRRWLAAALALVTPAAATATTSAPPAGAPDPQVMWHAAAEAYAGAGTLAERQGDLVHAAAMHEAALALRRRLEEVSGIAATLTDLGKVAYTKSDYDRAAALFEESASLARRAGDRATLMAALLNRGRVAYVRGEYAQAIRLYQESLRLHRAQGDRVGAAMCLNNLGAAAQASGDYRRAMRWFERSLALRRAHGETRGVALVLSNIGETARLQGDLPRALSLLTESLALFREQGDTWGVAQTLTRAGDVHAAGGQRERAAAAYAESLACHRRLGNRAGEPACWEALAHLILAEKPSAAAVLLAAATHVRDAIGVPLHANELPNHEAVLARLRAALGERRFTAAWARGARLVATDIHLNKILAKILSTR